MRHSRCKELESILRSELEEARSRIRLLEAELDARMLLPPPVGNGSSKGSTHYVEDQVVREGNNAS